MKETIALLKESARRNEAGPCNHESASEDESFRAAFLAKVRENRSPWPIQIKLASPDAPHFDGAKLLIAADCCAYTCRDFHEKYQSGKVTLIGCPKLDSTDYTEKLCSIFTRNNISAVTVARMEVPCCSTIVGVTARAIRNSGKDLPLKVATLSIDGEPVEQ